MGEKTLLEKLSNIQVELKAPKNQYNKFGKYYYRNNEDILEALKPICNKNRTTLVVCDEIEMHGNRYYVKAVATLYDWDSNNEISAEAFARETEDKKGMDSSQVTGATSSYARKYALNGLFNIDDTKDNDSAELKDEREERVNQTKSSNTNKSSKSSSTNSGTTVSNSIEMKIAQIQTYYKKNPKTFGAVLKGLLQGRRVSDLPEPELDGLLEIIETSEHSLGGE